MMDEKKPVYPKVKGPTYFDKLEMEEADRQSDYVVAVIRFIVGAGLGAITTLQFTSSYRLISKAGLIEICVVSVGCGIAGVIWGDKFFWGCLDFINNRYRRRW